MDKKAVVLTDNVDSTPSSQPSNVTSSEQERYTVNHNPEGEKIMDIKEFIVHVENFASNKLDFKFKNPGIQHAGAVLCAMARHAQKSFIVYDENLEGDITNGTDFYDQIEGFLSKGGKLSIITKAYPSDNEPKKRLTKLKDKFNGSVQLSYINPDALNSPNFDKSLINNCFTVVDDIGYRFEYDFPNRKAFFNFNDINESKKLIEKFERIKPYTSPI